MIASERTEPICGRASSCSLEAVLISMRAADGAGAGATVVVAGAVALAAGAIGAGVLIGGFVAVVGAAVEPKQAKLTAHLWRRLHKGMTYAS